MRVALTVDPEIPVPPRFYGGIERIVDMLARGMVKGGHEVTVFAHPESETAGRLIPWPGRASRSVVDTALNATTLAREVMRGRFDILHSFSRIAYLTPILPSGIPKLMTYQRAISPRTVGLGHKLSRGSLEFSAISEWMMRGVSHIGHWHMIPNGVSLEAYAFAPIVAPDAPLVFLGRVEEVKGPHLAIEIARRANVKLVIAGNVPPEKQSWFNARIAPHIDGFQIRFIGPVNDTQKNDLLGSARALVMPILWEEPFGIVMIEAMACGTPVLGFRRGAVPEVVEDGITGFVRDSVDDLVDAIDHLAAIDRQSCRQRVERFYSAEAVLEGYFGVYRSMMRRKAT